MAPAPRPPSPTQPWFAASVAALLLSLERPGSWWVALAGFLARGGVLLFLLPILVLHTPAGVQTELSPLLIPFLFAGASGGFVALSVAVAALTALGLLLGGLAGAWSEAILVREAADPEATEPQGSGGPAVVFAVLTARWLAHLPLVVALAWGAARIVAAIYREVTVPFEVLTPLVVRIVAAVPDAIAAVAIALLLGEAAGGLAARDVVLARRGAVRAAIAGWVGLVRRPLPALATLLLTSAVVLVAVGPGLVAASAAWRWVRAVLWTRGEPVEHVAALTTFVGLWLATIALAGMAAAFRSHAWTLEWMRRRTVGSRDPAAGRGWAVGTIGEPEGTRPDGWPSSGASGTL